MFLAVRHNIEYEINPIWYHSKPLGVNSIGVLLSKASKLLSNSSSTKGKVANHSARKTTISNLLGSNVHPLHVQQLSGHKKMESLDAYHVATTKQQKKMSSIINDSKLSSEMENHMSEDYWSEALPPSVSNTNPICNSVNNGNNHGELSLYGAFSGANNCTFTINIYNAPIQSPAKKRRRIIIHDDEED